MPMAAAALPGRGPVVEHGKLNVLQGVVRGRRLRVWDRYLACLVPIISHSFP
jgi:hypothetical protein